jgi:hypothetical protein
MCLKATFLKFAQGPIPRIISLNLFVVDEREGEGGMEEVDELG